MSESKRESPSETGKEWHSDNGFQGERIEDEGITGRTEMKQENKERNADPIYHEKRQKN